MSVIQNDQPIQALTTDRADQPLAERIRLRASHRRLQHRQTHRRNRLVDGGGKDGVTVVDEKSLGLVAWHNRPELLDGPTGRGMLRHVPMHDPTRTHVQHYKYVQHAEARRDGDEEIAREHRAGMVADEGAPPLGRSAIVRAPTSRHVTPDRARRHTNTKLEL